MIQTVIIEMAGGINAVKGVDVKGAFAEFEHDRRLCRESASSEKIFLKNHLHTLYYNNNTRIGWSFRFLTNQASQFSAI
jgi:hypothetical protein